MGQAEITKTSVDDYQASSKASSNISASSLLIGRIVPPEGMDQASLADVSPAPGRPHEIYTECAKCTGCEMKKGHKSQLSLRENLCNNEMCTDMRLRSCSSLPLDKRLADVVSIPPPLRLDAWSEAVAGNFNVRGVGYVSAGNRTKCPSEDSVFKLLTVDLVRSVQPNFKGLCAHPDERIQTALRKEQQSGVRELPNFVFAVNLCIPSSKAYHHHCVFYLGLEDVELIKDLNTPLGRVANPFFFGNSDEYRDKTFKLIPRIVDGNFVVRKAVGSKPTVLGSKVKQIYVQNERYFELIVDIGSDTIANSIVKLALGYCKTLVVDMMFLLEGHDETMLPERVLGGVRMINIDFKTKDGQRTCSQLP